MVFTLVDPNGKTLNPDDVQFGLRICLHGRFAITVTGTYTLVANADMKGQGSYGVPIRFDSGDAGHLHLRCNSRRHPASVWRRVRHRAGQLHCQRQ